MFKRTSGAGSSFPQLAAAGMRLIHSVLLCRCSALANATIAPVVPFCQAVACQATLELLLYLHEVWCRKHSCIVQPGRHVSVIDRQCAAHFGHQGSAIIGILPTASRSVVLLLLLDQELLQHLDALTQPATGLAYTSDHQQRGRPASACGASSSQRGFWRPGDD